MLLKGRRHHASLWHLFSAETASSMNMHLQSLGQGCLVRGEESRQTSAVETALSPQPRFFVSRTVNYSFKIHLLKVFCGLSMRSRTERSWLLFERSSPPVTQGLFDVCLSGSTKLVFSEYYDLQIFFLSGFNKFTAH